MFNKVVVYMTGHVGVMTNEGGGKRLPIFRDRERLFDIIERSVDRDQIKNTEEAVGIFCRALGKGKADNVVLVGIDMSKQYSAEELEEFDASFHIVEGSYNDIRRTDIENPIILPKVKADFLNLKMNDIVRFRFRNVYGQDSSARCRVVGLISNDNIFMQAVMFVELANLKDMMGYRPWECGNVQITLKNPARDAAKVADAIHGALKPGDAFMTAHVSGVSSARRPSFPSWPTMNRRGSWPPPSDFRPATWKGPVEGRCHGERETRRGHGSLCGIEDIRDLQAQVRGPGSHLHL
jgi:ABC-type lipoprotein release transport system permease subunit